MCLCARVCASRDLTGSSAAMIRYNSGVMQCVAVCCSVQHTAIYCNTLLCDATEHAQIAHAPPKCSTLLHTAIHRNTQHRNAPQYTATRCNYVAHLSMDKLSMRSNATYYYTMLYTATQHVALHCKTTATYCNIRETPLQQHGALEHRKVVHAKKCNIVPHKVIHCNTTRCNTLQSTASHCSTLQHSTTHCHTLHHTAIHCNTLQLRGAPEHGQVAHAPNGRINFVKLILIRNQMVDKKAIQNLLRNIRQIQPTNVNFERLFGV